jgi:hypothetical protein
MLGAQIKKDGKASRRTARWVSLQLLVITWCCNLPSQTVSLSAPAQQPGAQTPPPQIHVELRLAGGQTKFHIGEVVPIEITFTSTQHGTVSFAEDCLPRYAYQYRITPLGFTDRISERDAALEMELGAGCHGFSDQRDLLDEPLAVRQDLNDWFRMETSGAYQISVTVRRTETPLASNSVTLEILPRDAAWERQQLQKAIALLDAKPAPDTADPCKMLAYLETRDAELEMARRFSGRGNCGVLFFNALISARNRKPVLDILEAGLAQPDRPISQDYLLLLSMISMYQQRPDWYPQPEPVAQTASPEPTPRGWEEPPQRSGLWKNMNARREEELRYARLLEGQISQKTDAARAISLKTLLELSQTVPFTSVPPDFAAVAREQLPAVFRSLPRPDQNGMLQGDWRDLKSPAMVPVLHRMLVENNMGADRNLALRRLYELAPEEGRRIILEQLKTVALNYDSSVLSILPDKELPELDGMLLERLQKERSLSQASGYQAYSFAAMQLIDRYASSSIADALQREFGSQIGVKSFYGEYYLIAYFLRVDSPTGKEMLQKALVEPGGRPADLLQALVGISDSPEIERTAIELLESHDPATVAAALQALQQCGTGVYRQTLLTHFRSWSDRAKTPAADPQPGSGAAQAADRNMEMLYVRAIGSAQKWLPTTAELGSAQQFCISKACRDAIAQMQAASGRTHHSIEVFPANPFNGLYTFGLEQSFNLVGIPLLEEKLLEYPSANDFALESHFGRDADLHEIFNELQPWAQSHSVRLNPLPN